MSWRVFHDLGFADCIFLLGLQYFLLRIMFLNAKTKIHRLIEETHSIYLGIKLLKTQYDVNICALFKKNTLD